jgi:O-antigen/teichoic acid export membrane protein
MTASATKHFDHASLTAWNLVFHYANAVFLIVFGILLTPLYLRYIPEKTFGVWLATGNLVAWLSLVDPGLNAVVQQRIAAAYARGNNFAVSRLRTQSYVLSALLATAIAATGVIAAPWVARFVGRMNCELPRDVMAAYFWALAATATMTASYGAAAVTIGMQSPISSGVLYLLSQAASLVTIIGLLRAGRGVVSIPIGLLVQAAVLVMGHAAYSAYRFSKERIPAVTSLAGTMTILEDSRGTIMSRLAGALTANTDMLLAATFLGPIQAVSVNMTQKGPGLIRMFIDRLSHSAMPSLTAIHAGSDRDLCSRSTVMLLRTVVWLAIPAAVGVMLFNRTFVALWVGRHHYAGDAATAIIAVTVLAMGLEVTLSNLATSFGLFQANGRVQLIKSSFSGLLSVVMAWALGIRGLLAAPLVAGACTTWWLLPRLISRACGWGWWDWAPLAQEAVRVLAASVSAAAVAALVLREDVASFLIAGFVYASGCVATMAVALPRFRHVIGRVSTVVIRRWYSGSAWTDSP